MCFAPKVNVPEAQQYQAAQAPVFNEAQDDESRNPRRRTIAAEAPVASAAPGPGGKTLLGQ